jgi:hypothetical protein
MRVRIPFVFIMALMCSGLLPAQQAHYGKHGDALLPDPNVTTGNVAVSNKTVVCSTKWGKDERAVTEKMKESVYARYGTSPGQGGLPEEGAHGEKRRARRGRLRGGPSHKP